MQRFYRAITDPRADQVERIPQYPYPTRSATFCGTLERTITATLPNGGNGFVATLRDTAYPLWSSVQPPPLGSTGAYSGQATWHGEPLTTGSSPSSALPIGVYQSDQFRYNTRFTGEYELLTSFNYAKIVGSIAHPAGAVIARLGIVDDQPWLYVPSGAKLFVSVTLGVQLSYTTSSRFTFKILTDTAVGPDFPSASVETEIGPTTSGEQAWGKEISVADTYGRLGLFVRPQTVVVRNHDAEINANADETRIIINYSWVAAKTASQEGAITTAARPLTITPGEASYGFFYPVANFDEVRLASTANAPLIRRSCRVIGQTLTGVNVTKIMDTEGTIKCARAVEGLRYGLTRPPIDALGIVENERYFGKMASGIHYFDRPGTEADSFMNTGMSHIYMTKAADDMATTEQFLNSSCLFLRPGMSVMWQILEDPDGGSKLAYTLRQSLEFQSNDTLLNPKYPSGTLEQWHQAVLRAARERFFYPADRGLTLAVGASPQSRRARKNKKKKQDQPQQSNKKKEEQPKQMKAAKQKASKPPAQKP